MTSKIRPVYGLMGFRHAPDGKVFAATAPYRSGLLNGEEVLELPCTKGVSDASSEAQERWARAELAKRGKAFAGVHINDLH